MLKQVLSLSLVAWLFGCVALVPAEAKTDAAAREARFAEQVRENIQKLGTGSSARVEVRLKDKTKLKGYVAEASDEHFTVVDSEGKATRIAYAEVESVKAVKPKSARKKFDEKGLIGLGLIGGIFLLAFAVANGTK